MLELDVEWVVKRECELVVGLVDELVGLMAVGSACERDDSREIEREYVWVASMGNQ